ncbi:hypothetical protein O3G_MSEX001053 [Manduca sexta]|nr:hypothetical protein O3G_MSEX001053 [Manduca sexta]
MVRASVAVRDFIVVTPTYGTIYQNAALPTNL